MDTFPPNGNALVAWNPAKSNPDGSTGGWELIISTGGAANVVQGAGTIFKLLDAVTAGGPGSAIEIGIGPKTIQFILTGTATAEILKSNDGTNWEALISGVGSSQTFYNDEPWKYLKGNVPSYTNGAVTILVGV